MDNLKKLFRMTLKYWQLMVLGIFTMSIFSVLSGLSVTMAVPLFDYVFGLKHKETKFSEFTEFWTSLSSSLKTYFTDNSFFNLFSSESTSLLLNDLKELLSHTDPYLLLYLIGGAMIIIIILKSSFFYLNAYIFTVLRGKVSLSLRDIVYSKAIHLSIAEIQKRTIGDLQVRMKADVQIFGDLLIRPVFRSLRDLILIIAYASLAIYINSNLFLYTILIVPIFSLVVAFIGKKIKKYAKRTQNANASLYSRIVEVINGIKVVKSFAKEEYECDKYNTINRQYYKAWLKGRMYQALNVPLSELNGTITGMVVLIIGGNMVLSNPEAFSFGSFTAFLIAIFSILHPFKSITKSYTEMKKGMVSLDRAFEIMNLPPDIIENPNAVSKKDFNSSIEFKDLSFSYLKGTKVINKLNLTISKGQTVALVGSSGSGKTSLINLLERFYDPEEGSILIDDMNIKDIRIKDLHNLFGTVTQESILFHDTISNNIKYGTNKPVNDENVHKAAEIAYAYEFIKNMPKQYNSMLDPKGTNLSGGQKQRLCIARAIVGDPPILIFDEATSALDSESEQNVQRAIEMATKDRTVIIIAHRLSTILNADQIIVMDEGNIIGIGKHDDLIKTNEKYKLLYNIQFNK
ncbi:MAG: ATP-binding cassette domain-containing protein [Candidatus Delongbacteria bacterium]|nr:ATP-binding cassette domain-containing protein [Candidatus Delongbacteria bacterium]